MFRGFARSLVSFFLIFSTSIALAQDINIGVRSVGPEHKPAGRWLSAITVAGGVDISSALALRSLILRTFISQQSNFYRVAVDLNDLGQGGPEPTIEAIRKSFESLGEEIKAYKERHPDRQTMVAISLTGHGLTEGTDRYSFAASDGLIDGEEIAKWILDLEANEVILIVQSCQSGTLVESDFPLLIGEKFKEKDPTGTESRLLVLTPVPRNLNSPLMNWEVILQKAFEEVETDSNKDGIFQTQEWINEIIRHAIRDEYFVPVEILEIANLEGGRSLVGRVGGGISPMILEYNFPGDLPLLLTREGVERYLRRYDEWPIQIGLPIVLREEVVDLYRRQTLKLLKNISDRRSGNSSPAEKRLDELLTQFSKPVSQIGEIGCHRMIRSLSVPH